jgi:hypothetical protein
MELKSQRVYGYHESHLSAQPCHAKNADQMLFMVRLIAELVLRWSFLSSSCLSTSRIKIFNHLQQHPQRADRFLQHYHRTLTQRPQKSLCTVACPTGPVN